MSIVTVDEGAELTHAQWQARAGIGALDIDHLVRSRVLRLTPSGRYRLSFVGVVIFADALLYARPKFGAVDGLGMNDVLRILRSYFSRSSARRPHSDSERDPEFGDSEVLREFDALRGLQDWFFVHGVYQREQSISDLRGRPQWPRTIAKCPPLVTQDAVVYPVVLAERREMTLDAISALQIGLLRTLLERYGFPVPGSVHNAVAATGTGAWRWPLEESSRKYYERRLAVERRSVFRTHSLRLFELLHEILSSRLAAPDAQPHIYGTTAFYAVWEDACRTGIACADAAQYGALLGQPVWWSKGADGSKQRHEQEQIPDLVVRRGRWLLILDAKYYHPFPHARPGGPDIVKQLYYAESLRNPEAELLSIFLLPMPGATLPCFLGYATIEGARRGFGTIEAWGLDPAALLLRYPAISADRANAILDTIIRHRKGVAEFVGQAPPDVGS